MSTLQMVPPDPSTVTLATGARRLTHQIARLGWAGWFLIAVLSVAVALRLYHLGTPSLVLDELDRVTAAQRSLPAMFAAIRQRQDAAPLDYLVAALMVRTSHAEGVLRFPSVLWGVLSVYWLFRLGRRWHSPAAGLIAAALLAASVLHLRDSQELHSYSLFVFLTLASTEALAHAWRSGRWRSWLLYGALAMFMLYTEYYAALALAFQTVWVLSLWLERRGKAPDRAPASQLARFVIAVLAAILVFVPWVVYAVLGDGTAVSQTAPIMMWDTLEITLLALCGKSWPLWLLLAACGLAAQWRRCRANAVFLAVWVMLSLPLIVFIDLARGHTFDIRQMIFILPPFLLLVGMGVDALASGVGRVARGRWGEKGAVIVRGAMLVIMTGALLALSWPPITTYFRDRQRPEDWRNLGSLLSNNLSLDDAVVAWGAERFLGFYSPRAVQQAQDLASLADLEELHATSRPLWVLLTPYLDRERDLDAAAIRAWTDRQPAVVFDLGAGFKLFYLQAGHDREALWQVAQNFVLPADRPDLLVAYAKELGSLDTEVALSTLVTAAAQAPDATARADLLFRAGSIALRRSDYSRANELFDQALAARPDLAEVYLRKGFALLEMGQPQAALAALTAAHEQFGRDDYWVHRWLGIALDRLNRPAEALPHFLVALDRSPDAHEMRFLIGAANAELGDKAAAESWLRDYLARDPAGAWARQAQQLLATLTD